MMLYIYFPLFGTKKDTIHFQLITQNAGRGIHIPVFPIGMSVRKSCTQLCLYACRDQIYNKRHHIRMVYYGSFSFSSSFSSILFRILIIIVIIIKYMTMPQENFVVFFMLNGNKKNLRIKLGKVTHTVKRLIHESIIMICHIFCVVNIFGFVYISRECRRNLMTSVE